MELGGSDNVENGLCLCANHHLLFDAGLLEMNFETKTFICNSDSEKKMAWYVFADKNGRKLHIE